MNDINGHLKKMLSGTLLDIKGNNMPYDLSATVHHTPRRNGSGHYTAISRSRDLQSHEWFMYDDD
jgi:hypothetical protein